MQINVHFRFITHKDQSMHYIPLKRSAGVVIFYGLCSSNAGIIVRKSIKLMHEIITIVHTKSDSVAV